MVVERLLILGLLAGGLLALWGLGRLWQRRRVARLREDSPFGLLVPAGRPAVVSFSTADCTICRTRQAPALQRLSSMTGERVTVTGLSALDHPELLSRLGILTVPATVILDERGTVRHLNLGFASEGKLLKQLEEVSPHLAPRAAGEATAA